ncbi:ABC transporter substrate-binding protein [Demequina sp. SYSU T00068]|uniref:ABC transporter substrate-binding protein n=1 Tax=Demequina lignilytica TaxID=3051663 RepID=UPI00262AF35D|nr:ABC transporter substrate-binding protein [Demequina sp. SYSU T00068]MDN4491442.1 ABC transporter substrate-binding protein [Demequina sp. SYSU T00068]
MKTHIRLARTAIPATALALVLASCSGTSDETGTPEPTSETSETASASGVVAGSVLRVNWGGFPESWAPGAEMEAGYMRVPYENLTQLGEGGAVEPMLAASWEQTDTALTLTLQDGVTFHDGTPFDAEAVKANIELIQSTPGPYAGPFQVITSIDVVDDLTVTFNLAQPSPSLLTTLSTRAAPMASPAAIETGTIAQTPVGTGPWAYDEAASIAGTRMAFVAYDGYWDEVPAYETVQLFAIQEDNAATTAMINGEIDITDSEVDQWSTFEGAGGFQLVTYPAIRNNPMFFDRGPGGLFEDVKVRQAACYAIDTQVVADLEPDVTVTTQHFAEGTPGYNPEVTGYTHDLAMAESLMAEAGSPSISGEMMSTVFNNKQITIYAEQMGEIGIEIAVQEAPPPQYFSEWNSGKYPIGLGSNDELTPYDWYASWFAADAPGNPSGVESDELKAAADAAIAAGASEEADALWAEVTKVIADEALTCAHIASEEQVVVNSDNVTGADVPSQPYETVLINYRDLRPAGE